MAPPDPMAAGGGGRALGATAAAVAGPAGACRQAGGDVGMPASEARGEAGATPPGDGGVAVAAGTVEREGGEVTRSAHVRPVHVRAPCLGTTQYR